MLIIIITITCEVASCCWTLSCDVGLAVADWPCVWDCACVGLPVDTVLNTVCRLPNTGAGDVSF